MTITKIRMALLALALYLCTSMVFAADGIPIKGIYLTQNTLENTTYLKSLIRKAKATGINTFVVDIKRPSKRYRSNIALVKDNGIKYVARVVIFPHGGTKQQVKSPAFWQKPYKLVKYAIDYGADEIQLDYIRYNTKQRQTSKNAHDINEIIKWYKTKIGSQGIPMQIDVFGETAFGESKAIGQNVELFAANVDTICPMVYPSHYTPAGWHYRHPYETVYDSLDSIQEMFDDKTPFKLIAYIEIGNYRYRMSNAKKATYLREQIEAVQDAKADGFYVWSAHNRYDILFDVLQKWGSQPKKDRTAYRSPKKADKQKQRVDTAAKKQKQRGDIVYKSIY